MRFSALLLLFGVLVSPVGDAVAQTVVPQAGEGIWGVLRRSGIEPNNERVAAFKELNAARLADGDQLVAGVSYQLPDIGGASAPTAPVRTATSEGRRYPIFGPDYELVTRRSDRLVGHVYYIVSGHGGPDPGSVGVLDGRSMPEDEIAYDTALRLARRILEEGGTAYMIVRDPDDGIRDLEYLPPDKDEFFYGDVSMSSRYKRRLRQRRDAINALYDKNRSWARSQQVIAVHVDAMGGRHQPQIDVHFAYASDNGRGLGRALQSEIEAQYATHQPGRGYNGRLVKRDLYILNETKPTAVLVELGNIRHRGDQVRLTKPGNRQALADWIAEGLLRQLGVGEASRRSAE